MALDTYTVAADAIKQIIDAEFADLNVAAIHDNIHESLGAEDRTVGIAPVGDRPTDTNADVGYLTIEVRFYDFYDLEVDPTQSVDPRIITNYAKRLKEAIRVQQAATPGTGEVWYFMWLSTEYPDDPTGNKSRFHMRIAVYGNNVSLRETSG